MEGDDTKDRLLTAGEMADILHVSKVTAYNLMRWGEIPSVRMGRLVRVRVGDLEKYIRENTGLNSKEQNGETTRVRP